MSSNLQGSPAACVHLWLCWQHSQLPSTEQAWAPPQQLTGLSAAGDRAGEEQIAARTVWRELRPCWPSRTYAAVAPLIPSACAHQWHPSWARANMVSFLPDMAAWCMAVPARERAAGTSGAAHNFGAPKGAPDVTAAEPWCMAGHCQRSPSLALLTSVSPLMLSTLSAQTSPVCTCQLLLTSHIVLPIDIDPQLSQLGHHGHIARPRGEVQGAAPVLVPGIHVGPVAHEVVHHGQQAPAGVLCGQAIRVAQQGVQRGRAVGAAGAGTAACSRAAAMEALTEAASESRLGSRVCRNPVVGTACSKVCQERQCMI